MIFSRTGWGFLFILLFLESFSDANPLVRRYRLATCGSSNEIKLWSLTSKSVLKYKSQAKHEVVLQLLDVLDAHTSSVTCIRYSNSGNHFVSSSLDKLVKIWDGNGDCIATLENHTRYVNCVAISRDSSLVVSGKYLKKKIQPECHIKSHA